jgi:hypothetical protein
MLGELIKDAATGIGGMKAAVELVKSLYELNATGDKLQGQDERQGLILALQKRLGNLMDEHIALHERLLKLQTIDKRKKRFLADRKNYVLKETYARSFAYVANKPVNDGDPAIHLCVECFENDKRSLLQLKKRDFGFDVVCCHACGGETQITNDITATIQSAGPRRDWSGW